MIALVVIVIALMFRKPISDFMKGSLILDAKEWTTFQYREFWRAFHVAQDRKVNGLYWEEVREMNAKPQSNLKIVI